MTRPARRTQKAQRATIAAVAVMGALCGPPQIAAARALDDAGADPPAATAGAPSESGASSPPAGTPPAPASAAPTPDPAPAPASKAAAEPASGGSSEETSEDAKPRVRIDAVNIVAHKRQTVFDSVRAASAIERDELRMRPPRSSGDALLDEEAVFLQRPSYNSALPSLRGLSAGHVLLLVDGVRLNSTVTSTLPGGFQNINLVDPYTLDAVEIVRGPGLAAYGTEGLGGTIQLRTRRPAPIAGSNIELNGGARGIYTSADQAFQGSISGGGRWSRYALDTAFSTRRFTDLHAGPQGGGSQPFTGYNEGGLYLGAGADVGHGALVFVYQGMRQYDGLRSERSQPGDLYVLSEVARDLLYLRYDGSFEMRNQTVDVSATVSYHRHGEEANRQRLDVDRLEHSVNRDHVIGVQAHARVDLGRGGHLSGGLDGYFEFVSSSAERGTVSGGIGGALASAPELQRYPTDSGAQNFALFVQDELDLERLFRGDRANAARAGRLRLLVAGRIGGNVLSIGRDDRVSRLLPQLMQAVREARTLVDPVYAGSLHVRYEFYPGLAVFAGVLTSARLPNLDDYARLDAGRPGLLLPTTADLRPEAAYTAEGGVRAGTRYIEGAATYAYTYLDSPITVGSTPLASPSCQLGFDGRCAESVLSRYSADAARLHSVEASLRARLFWGLSAWGTLLYTRGEVTRPASPGMPASGAGAAPVVEPMWRVPPLSGVAALQFRRARSVWSFTEVSLRWAAPQRRLAAQDRFDPTVCSPSLPICEGTPGYLIVSVRSSLRLARQMFLSGAIENITNDAYRLHGSGITAAGLGANIALEANY